MGKGLHKKYLLSILSVGAVSLIVVLSAVWLIEKNELKSVIGAGFKELAEATSENIDSQIRNHIEIAKLMAGSNAVTTSVSESNDFYEGDEQEVKKRIFDINKRWIGAEGVNAYLLEIMSNRATLFLKRNLNSNDGGDHGLHALIMVTNNRGATVASTDRPESYYYGDQAWWKTAFNNGAGSTYVSDIHYNEKMGINTFAIAVPIMKKSVAVGVFYMVHNVDTFFKAVTMARVGQTDHTMIVNESGTVIYCPELPVNRHTKVVVGKKDLLSNHSGWRTGTDDVHFPGRESINGYAPVKVSMTHNSSSYGGKKWYVVTSQDPRETFASVDTLLNMVALIVLIGLALVSVLGWVATGKMVRPIKILIKGSELIGGGDLDHRINIKTGDELEDLALKINDMALKLKIFYIRLDEKVKERTVQLEHRNKELDLLYNMSSTLNKTLDLELLQEEVPEKLIELMNADSALLWLPGKGGAGKIVKNINLDKAVLDDKKLELMLSLISSELEKNQMKIWQTENTTVDYRLEEIGYTNNAYLSLVGIPLISQEKLFGIIVLFYKQIYALTPWEENVMLPIGNHIGVVLEHAMMFNKRQTSRDCPENKCETNL